MKIYLAESTDKTCDTCDSQEGRHYCLLYGVDVKNMDIMVCDDWIEEGGKDEA